MQILKHLAFVALALAMGSCGPNLRFFTEDLRVENNWTEQELQQVQFYLSEDIILRRQLSGTQSTIEGGSIKIVNGNKVEEIVIRQGTPGVLVKRPKEDRFAIAFEGGNTPRFLMFGPNPNAERRYVLLASEWEQRQGKVTYGSSMYLVGAEDSMASLMVDLKRRAQVAVQSETANGRRVGQ